MFCERLSSLSSFFCSLVRRSISAEISTRSEKGMYTVASASTTETASSAMPSLFFWHTDSEAYASDSKKSLPVEKISRTSSLSLTTNTLAFLEGATFICVRTLRIPLTASFIVSIAFSSDAKFHSSLYTGHSEIMIDSSSS